MTKSKCFVPLLVKRNLCLVESCCNIALFILKRIAACKICSTTINEISSWLKCSNKDNVNDLTTNHVQR